VERNGCGQTTDCPTCSSRTGRWHPIIVPERLTFWEVGHGARLLVGLEVRLICGRRYFYDVGWMPIGARACSRTWEYTSTPIAGATQMDATTA